MVTQYFVARICDFSFACHPDSPSNSEFTYGTDEFMSPEIALATKFDFSTDMFSFGVVLCEIITGIQPSSTFLCRQARDGFALHEEEVRSRVLPGCPEPLEALTYQCCLSDPSRRPTSGQCLQELEALLQTLPPLDVQHTQDTQNGTHYVEYSEEEEEEEEKVKDDENSDNEEDKATHNVWVDRGSTDEMEKSSNNNYYNNNNSNNKKETPDMDLKNNEEQQQQHLTKDNHKSLKYDNEEELHHKGENKIQISSNIDSTIFTKTTNNISGNTPGSARDMYVRNIFIQSSFI